MVGKSIFCVREYKKENIYCPQIPDVREFKNIVKFISSPVYIGINKCMLPHNRPHKIVPP